MRRALQLVVVLGGVGLLLAGVLATREILGAASPAFAWPSPRGLVLGYPASLVDFVIYAAIVAAAAIGLVLGHARDRSAMHAIPRRYVSPWRRMESRSRRRQSAVR